MKTSMELFPAGLRNVMQSEIVANGKSRLVGNFISTHFITRTNLLQYHGLVLFPALIKLIIVSSILTFHESIFIDVKNSLKEKTLLKVKQVNL